MLLFLQFYEMRNYNFLILVSKKYLSVVKKGYYILFNFFENFFKIKIGIIFNAKYFILNNNGY